MTPGYFHDLKQQAIDAVLCNRPAGLRLLWDLAERQCTDAQLIELRVAIRQARGVMHLLECEARIAA